MTDQTLPQFVDDDFPSRPVRPAARTETTYAPTAAPAPTTELRKLSFIATLDKPLIIITGLLLAIGMMMVFSATFDWSLIEFGSETFIFNQHVRNVAIGLAVMALFSMMNPRILRRFALIIMLLAISFLIAVLIFGDDKFGARRALIDGRFQPGEFSELATIIYLSAWLSAKRTRVRSFLYGMLPFTFLVAFVSGLVVLQPDLSTTVVILLTTSVMYFLAGADMRQIGAAALLVVVLAFALMPLMPNYAMERVDSFRESITDPTKANYHTQQALIAFFSGGWTGVGLGESRQKFLALPAPHTDSIFAVIGEELGVAGASMVVLLYVAFVVRAFQIARQSPDFFASMLAASIAVWVAVKAVLNIAVMTALVPSTGLPLPFISFGGSSLVVLMVGVGLLLSVQRDTLIRQNSPERRKPLANINRSGRDRRARVSRTGRSGVDS